MARIDQITIVGLGLIGGSLGMALRKKCLVKKVVGWARAPITLRQAKSRGAIDVGIKDFRKAVCDSQIVIIATPVETIAPLVKRAASFMKPGSIITDVGSTKEQIVKQLDREKIRSVHFIGGHPLAGSDRTGIGAAHGELFDGSVCVLTPSRRTDLSAHRKIIQFWKPLVRHVVSMSPRKHDKLVAGASHLPHLVAFALARSADISELPRAPRSFMEMTRIAKSDPDLWDDIVLSNRAELLVVMDRFERQWRLLRLALKRSDRNALLRFMAGAKSRRDALKD